MDNFKITHKPNIKHIRQMLELDNITFNEYDIVSIETVLKWYKKNPNIYTVLLLNNDVIGYINFAPIKEEVYNNFKNDIIYDAMLTEEDIENFTPGKYHNCLFMSIVIKKEYRDGIAVSFLSNALDEKLKKLHSDNIFIKKVLIDCITEDDLKYSQENSFNFYKKTNEAVIFANMSTPIF